MFVTRRWYEIGALLIALALLVTFAVLLSQANGMVLANGQPMFGDFIAFWSAGRAALEGHVADVHMRATIAEYHQLAAPGVAFVATWSSPPTFLLVMSALAQLPYPSAALVFLAVGAFVYIAAAWVLLPDRRALVLAMTLPAALYHIGTVQTGLLVAGLTGLAIYWVKRRPIASGFLVGLLAIKPHLALLWPLMLAMQRRRRAFMTATITALAFAALSGFVFGFDAWERFFANLGSAQSVVAEQLISTPAYASLYASLLQLGAPQAVAVGVHIAAATLALVVAISVFASGDRARGGAALCAATLLILPYVFFYDFTLLAVGAALLGEPRDRLGMAAAVAAWSAGLSLPLSYIAPLPYAPLAAALVLMVSAREGSAAPRPAPAPQR